MINGKVSISGEAIYKNFMSEAAAKSEKYDMEAYVVAANAIGIPLTFDDVLNTYMLSVYFFCKNADSCNSYDSIELAGRYTYYITYDQWLNNGVFDIGSGKMI